jgi:hypothetical protein
MSKRWWVRYSTMMTRTRKEIILIVEDRSVRLSGTLRDKLK